MAESATQIQTQQSESASKQEVKTGFGSMKGNSIDAEVYSTLSNQNNSVLDNPVSGINDKITDPISLPSSPEMELEKLKSGFYDNDPQKAYSIAAMLLMYDQMNKIKLSDEDHQLLINTTAVPIYENETEAIVAMMEATQQRKLSEQEKQNIDQEVKKEKALQTCVDSIKKKDDYKLDDVTNAAVNIINGEASVKNAMLFFSRIKHNAPKADWDAELRLFLPGGVYAPNIQLVPLTNQGETKPDGIKRPFILINKNNSFSVSVSTLLHELNHYIDMWYSSKEAYDLGKYRDPAEMGAPIEQFEDSDPGMEEQATAMKEGLRGTIDTIMKEVTQETEPIEYVHPRSIKARVKYQAWLKEQEQDPKWAMLPETEQTILKNKKIEKIRKGLTKAGVKTYRDWGARRAIFSKEIKGSGLELGYAFDKMAHGFFNPDDTPGEWGTDFDAKFRRAYCKYLQ